MYSLINFIVTVLIIGAIIHWIITAFSHSYREEVVRIRELLDRIFVPMLDVIRNYVKPIRLSDGRHFDLSYLILIIGLALVRRIALFLF